MVAWLLAARLVFRSEVIWAPRTIFSIDKLAWYRDGRERLVDPRFHPEMKTGISFRPCCLMCSPGQGSRFWFFCLIWGWRGRRKKPDLFVGRNSFSDFSSAVPVKQRTRQLTTGLPWQTHFLESSGIANFCRAFNPPRKKVYLLT